MIRELFARRGWIVGMAVAASLPAVARAALIWTAGPGDLTFTKLSGAAPTDPANQDRITDRVWITRGSTQGLYNAELESAFNTLEDVSPADTQWAFSGVNGNPTFTYGAGAAMYQSLTFASWETALGSTGNLQTNITSDAGVVHLLTDDIYLDIKFLSWGTHGDGGFSYQRAVAPSAVPEPAGMCMMLPAALLVLCRRRRA